MRCPCVGINNSGQLFSFNYQRKDDTVVFRRSFHRRTNPASNSAAVPPTGDRPWIARATSPAAVFKLKVLIASLSSNPIPCQPWTAPPLTTNRATRPAKSGPSAFQQMAEDLSLRRGLPGWTHRRVQQVRGREPGAGKSKFHGHQSPGARSRHAGWAGPLQRLRHRLFNDVLVSVERGILSPIIWCNRSLINP